MILMQPVILTVKTFDKKEKNPLHRGRVFKSCR